MHPRSVLSEPLLVVRQVWPTPNSVAYEVFDGRGDRLATAAYVPDDEVAALMRTYGLRPWTADALRVTDQDDRPLLTVAFPGMRGRGVMLIRDGDGNHLGEAVKTDGFRKVRYELRHDERVVGAIQVVDWRQRAVRVEDATGTEVALVRTIDEGYSLQVERPLDEPLRSLVVASCLALQAAIGDEAKPGTNVEHGGGTTIVRMAVLPPIFDRLRRKRG